MDETRLPHRKLNPALTLARKLRTLDYFTLGFGTMVGVGWLVVMDDWLGRGGPLGAILGFAIGGAALLPIGYVYGRLAIELPDAGSEIAYTEKVFPAGISFATGWMMTLAYIIVCPWESVAIGKIAAFIFPSLNSLPLYRVGGNLVYLPQLAIGLLLAAVITGLNYRGIRSSATFQNWATFGLLALFVIFASFGVAHGSTRNFTPPFSRSGWVSVLLVIQIVPYFMTGFESVPKCAEEANPGFRSRGFFRAILAAILVGIAFYTAVIAVVAYIYPWQMLTRRSFATAFAFERALGNHWIVDIIFAAALFSLLKVYNGNFIAGARLVFAMGRRGLLDRRMAYVEPSNRTPAAAILAIGLVSAAATFMGESILVPITEVGALASAAGWLATCVSYLRMKPRPAQCAVAGLGGAVSLAIILMKLIPFVPGHFTGYEYLALGLWAAAGWALKKSH
ncbi:MAG: APC family permease [Terriglobia bacterium]